MSNGWHLDSVISRIETLYTINDSNKIREIQDYLQEIQKSSEGYKLGQLLLNQESKICKYFGALTITVFINTHVSYDSSPNAEYLHQLASEILAHVCNLSFNVNDEIEFNQNLFIIKKLLSNLSLLYITHFKTFQKDPIDLMIFSFGDNTDINSLNQIQILLLLYLSSILVEDLGKKNLSSQELHAVVFESIFSKLKSLLSITSNSANSKVIQIQVLECINAWFVYISNAESNSSQRYTFEDLDVLVQILIHHLNSEAIARLRDDEIDLEVLEKTFSVLTEVIETNPRILSKSKLIFKSILFDEGQFGSQFIQKFVIDDDLRDEYGTEIESFISMTISFLNIDIIHISRNIHDPSIARIIDTALKLTNIPGRPVVDEKASELFLSFWEELINIYVDDSEVIKELFDQNYDEFLAKRNELLTKISFIYWSKARLYEGSSAEFLQYRLQIADLFNLLYSLLNISLYASLCQSISEKIINLDPSHIADLEASIYLLYRITDDLAFYDDDSTNDLVPYLDQIFSHNLIENVGSIPTETQTGKQIQLTLLNFLSSIPFFFKSKEQFLTSTFNFLFSIILDQGKKLKNISLIASKTALKICQNSKLSLLGFLPNIGLILSEMIKNPEVDNLIRERLVNSYISIARSMKDPSEFAEVAAGLLRQIQELSFNLMSNPELFEQSENLEDYAISLLSCINEIGESCQLPEEVEDFLTPEEINRTNSYWQEDPLKIKELVIYCLNQFALSFGPLINNTIVTEKCCNILKSGLNEPVDGPFRFDLNVIVSFLTIKVHHCNPPSIHYIYKLMETVIITNSKRITSQDMDNLIDKVFVQKLPHFIEDVDLMKAAMEYFSTVIERAPGLIVHLDVFQTKILQFALLSLSYQETFLIKAVAKFWTNLISLKRGKQIDHDRFNAYMNGLIVENNKNLCQVLTEKLLFSFLHNPRSNLDQFYPIFRNLIVKHPLIFKNSLKLVMNELVTNNQKISHATAEQFINKLMLTRGQRQANDVLKRFWLEYNGLVNYGS